MQSFQLEKGKHLYSI